MITIFLELNFFWRGVFQLYLFKSHMAYRDTRQRIHEAQETLKTEIKNLEDVAKEVDDTNRFLRTSRNDIKAISELYYKKQAELEQLKDTEQPDINSVSVLREELSAKERELEAKKAQLTNFPVKLEALEKEKEELRDKGQDLKKKEKELSDQREILEKKQRSCRDQLEEIKSAQVGKKRKLDQTSKQEEVFTKECDELSSKCEKCMADAEKYEAHIKSEAEEKGQEFASMSATKR